MDVLEEFGPHVRLPYSEHLSVGIFEIRAKQGTDIARVLYLLINARKQQNLTQQELSERTGITQADISRIENGTRNPSLEMLKRLAKGMGMQLKLEFISTNQR